MAKASLREAEKLRAMVLGVLLAGMVVGRWTSGLSRLGPAVGLPVVAVVSHFAVLVVVVWVLSDLSPECNSLHVEFSTAY